MSFAELSALLINKFTEEKYIAMIAAVVSCLLQEKFKFKSLLMYKQGCLQQSQPLDSAYRGRLGKQPKQPTKTCTHQT